MIEQACGFLLLLAFDAYLPPLEWTGALPCFGTCKMMREANIQYQMYLRARINVQQYRNDLPELLRECERRYRLWDVAEDAMNPVRGTWRRRASLLQLMDLLDAETVCELAEPGRLPMPFPMDRGR